MFVSLVFHRSPIHSFATLEISSLSSSSWCECNCFPASHSRLTCEASPIQVKLESSHWTLSRWLWLWSTREDWYSIGYPHLHLCDVARTAKWASWDTSCSGDQVWLGVSGQDHTYIRPIDCGITSYHCVLRRLHLEKMLGNWRRPKGCL